ncbi:MAG: adenylyl-sulfate kinase [Nitrospiraceae bacterium]|nr:MAG: adenylyl-sulfate kinase [Nitrospiraceae bacterium]
MITNYTGIDAPYEEPEKPDLIIDTEKSDVIDSVKGIIEFLNKRNFFRYNSESLEKSQWG